MSNEDTFEQHINREGHDGHDDHLFKEGRFPFDYEGEIHQIYYSIAGDLDTSNRTPLIMIHGGPGLSSGAGFSHSDLTKDYGIPVLLYDQIGGGKSAHLPHKPAEFWNVELFCKQLDQLLRHFKLEDNFSILGHSWGGLFAAHYVQTRAPRGLRHLVFVGAPTAIKLMQPNIRALRDNLPERISREIAKKRNGEEYDKAVIEEGHAVFFRRHNCQLDPMPEGIVEAMKEYAEDPTVFDTMLNMDHTGPLKDFTVVERLHEIKVPALVINGKDDLIHDEAVEPMFYRIEKAKRVKFMYSSHMPFLEERVKYMKIVGEFLINTK